MGREGYKEREKSRREDDILKMAEQLIGERGYANLTMDELAEMVGISKPTLYQHFKSKEDIAVRACIRGFDEVVQFLEQPLREPAIERLTGLLRWWVTKRAGVGGNLMG